MTQLVKNLIAEVPGSALGRSADLTTAREGHVKPNVIYGTRFADINTRKGRLQDRNRLTSVIKLPHLTPVELFALVYGFA